MPPAVQVNLRSPQNGGLLARVARKPRSPPQLAKIGPKPRYSRTGSAEIRSIPDERAMSKGRTIRLGAGRRQLVVFESFGSHVAWRAPAHPEHHEYRQRRQPDHARAIAVIWIGECPAHGGIGEDCECDHGR